MKETTVKRYRTIISRYDRDYDPDKRNGKQVIAEIADDLCLSENTVRKIVYKSQYAIAIKNYDVVSFLPKDDL